ncbi:membrane protein US12 [Cercopithecine betaherpesvirus 5]|uniref:Membrane protein US12 n=1 Tax=Simian cytomegalovirus (strain Colburn) TaxID=50292 RepID=G8XU51_SCMVC|nr:membrane protein US12 [Cercopithecine betaherpesvirus 5]
MGRQPTYREENDDCQEVMRWVRRFVWLVRVYTALAVQMAVTLALCLLCVMYSWKIHNSYLKDIVPIWMMIVPTLLRFNLRKKSFRTTTVTTAVVYTVINSLALAIWSMCLERSVLWQAYIFSLVLELGCTVLGCVLASTRPRGSLIAACLILALPLFCAIVYYQPWTPSQKWIAVLTAAIVDLMTLALLHDTLLVLCYTPRSLFDRHAVRAALLLYVDQVLVLMMAVVPITADSWYPDYFPRIPKPVV